MNIPYYVLPYHDGGMFNLINPLNLTFSFLNQKQRAVRIFLHAQLIFNFN